MTGAKIAVLVVPGVLLAAVAGTAVGVRYHEAIVERLTGRVAAATPEPLTEVKASADEKTLYTCSMHPSIIRDKPGLCPICHMELTVLHVHGDNQPASTVQIDPVTVQNMGVRTAPVIEGELKENIRAVGTLTEPEEAHYDVNLRVSGWIETLYASKEGMEVNPGDRLFDLYSPEITAAADELIAARKALANVETANDPVMKRSSETVMAAGKRKLQLLGLSAEQVDEIAKLDKAPATVTIAAPMHGHIAEKMVVQGAAVRPGEALMKIANRSQMWLQLQVYEQQLGLVKVGQKVRAKIAAYPEQVFEGTVDFVYPHLDPATRSATVRVVLSNATHTLHENMYATAEIEVPAMGRSILVPREAVIDTGKRQVVFVTGGDGRFEARDVSIGRSGRIAPSEPEMVQVASGLNAGETVVTSGQFLLDSESRMREAVLKYQRKEEGTEEGMGGGMAAAPEGRPAGGEVATVTTQAAADGRVSEVISAYLPLAEKLGAVQAEATALDVTALEKASEKLANSDDAGLRSAGEKLAALVKALEGQPLDVQRTKFKAVSKVVVGMAQKAPAENGKLYAFTCTMDNSVWLQTNDVPANPYFAVEMKKCGEVTGTIGSK